MYKLMQLGVSEKLLDILCLFLSNRSQRVLVLDSLSESLPVIRGVPQVSVIGSLIFIVYINNLLDSIPTSSSSIGFADVIKLYTQIDSIEDVDRIQCSVELISIWAHD